MNLVHRLAKKYQVTKESIIDLVADYAFFLEHEDYTAQDRSGRVENLVRRTLGLDILVNWAATEYLVEYYHPNGGSMYVAFWSIEEPTDEALIRTGHYYSNASFPLKMTDEGVPVFNLYRNDQLLKGIS